MNTNFLPDGYDKLKVERPYWKMSQMKEGENRLRIVTKPIAGWLDWIDNKPRRYRPHEKPLKSHDPMKPMRPFWAMYVWDYARNAPFVLEITQNSLIKQLTALGSDEDWGDFRNYDIKLMKKGSGKETQYSITPVPKKALPENYMETIKKNPVRLEALYEGGDPWADVDPFAGFVNEDRSEFLTQEQSDQIDIMLEDDEDTRRKILSHLGIASVRDILAKDYDRTITYIRKRKKMEQDHDDSNVA